MAHLYFGRRLAVLLLIAACPLALSAATDISLQGTFLADDSLRSFWVKITTPSTVTMKTLSYAGGENSMGETVAGGGFAPVLTLFSGLNHPDGIMMVTNDEGGCGAVGMDAATLRCSDSFLLVNLQPGFYTLVLSQTGNTANGPFGAGFTRAGQINYTGLEFVGIPDMFWDGTPSKRTDFWAVDILNADSAGEIPEPATFLILGTGLIALRYLARRMRRSQITASRN